MEIRSSVLRLTFSEQFTRILLSLLVRRSLKLVRVVHFDARVYGLENFWVARSKEK